MIGYISRLTAFAEMSGMLSLSTRNEPAVRFTADMRSRSDAGRMKQRAPADETPWKYCRLVRSRVRPVARVPRSSCRRAAAAERRGHGSRAGRLAAYPADVRECMGLAHPDPRP